jgi:hypothetical protein
MMPRGVCNKAILQSSSVSIPTPVCIPSFRLYETMSWLSGKAAIDRYFNERNAHFMDYPQRAGVKVWGKEPGPSNFSEFNNCKDPRFR